MSGKIEQLGLVPYVELLPFRVRPRALMRAAATRVGELIQRCHDLGLSVGASADFSALYSVQQNNVDSGFEPLLPFIDYNVRPKAEGNWIGITEGSRVVATAAAVVIYIPTDSSLRAKINDLSVFVQAPAVLRAAGGRAECSAPTARDVFGHVAILSGGWVHPDFRRQGLAGAVVALAALAAHGLSVPDWTIGFIDPSMPKNLTFGGYRFRRSDSQVELQLPGRSTEAFVLGAARRAEFEADVIGWKGPLSEADAAEIARATQYWSESLMDQTISASAAE